MKKLKLKLDDLEVNSFAAQDEQEQTGTVNAMESDFGETCYWDGCRPSYWETQCVCTHAEGCYPSLYCSQGGVRPGEVNYT